MKRKCVYVQNRDMFKGIIPTCDAVITWTSVSPTYVSAVLSTNATVIVVMLQQLIVTSIQCQGISPFIMRKQSVAKTRQATSKVMGFAHCVVRA